MRVSQRRPESPPAAAGRAGFLVAANRWLAVLVIAMLCLSGLHFCLYIALTYVAPLLGGNPEQWNANSFLPGLYDAENAGSTGAIGLHFITGALAMVLGCVQLLNPVRRRLPRVHRWIGRLYVVLALLTAFGGLGFIVLQGTVGAGAMNVGFGLYGVLMIVAAVQTIRCARTRDFTAHRAWGLRLFVLVIASWLYRMEYSVSALLELGGRTPDFRGWFDLLMNFFFYLPNLMVAELYLRAGAPDSSRALRVGTFAALLVSFAVVAGGIYTQV